MMGTEETWTYTHPGWQLRFLSHPPHLALCFLVWFLTRSFLFLVCVFSRCFGDRRNSVVVVVLTDAYFVVCSSHGRRCYDTLTYSTAAWKWWVFLFFVPPLSFVLPFV